MSRRVARQENFQEAFPENVPSLQLIMKKKLWKIFSMQLAGFQKNDSRGYKRATVHKPVFKLNLAPKPVEQEHQAKI